MPLEDDAPSIAPGARRIVTIGLVLGMAVVAMEATVVTTALPTIVGELDRLDLYPWVFSAYLLTSTVTVPLYGKLADLFGRKRVFMFGITLFLAGSMLCGLAGSMTQLILFRAVQGLGAGAVMPTVFTLVADVYQLHERARIQGIFSTLWGTTSLFGPALGAWLTVAISWRAVFFVGVPFGLAAGILFWRCFQERVAHREVKLDLAGSGLLLVGLTTLLLSLTEGSEGAGWGSPLVAGLLAASVALLGGFIVAELRAADPVLPLGLFRLRLMTVSSAGNFLSGAILFGVTSYVPLYVQGARGEGAAGAGAVLTPMLVGWAISGYFGPRLLLRFGFRPTALGSSLLLAVGSSGLAFFLAQDTPALVLYVSVSLMGLGFGPGTAAFIMALQDSVPWNIRGVATSSTQLFRSLGGTLSVALLGTILHAGLVRRLADAGLDEAAVAGVLNPSGDAVSGTAGVVQAALTGALQPVFMLTFAAAVAIVVLVAVFARSDDWSPTRRPAAAAAAPAVEPL
ncbi:MAG: MFS transporter [Chloroflexi bacterium]|nr:MFS transporter [Chloroflexota bacterium]